MSVGDQGAVLTPLKNGQAPIDDPLRTGRDLIRLFTRGCTRGYRVIPNDPVWIVELGSDF